MDTELEALLAQLSPEELQQVMGLGTVPQRSKIVEAQLAQADALRNTDVGNFSTPGGAALGGLGNVLGKVQGGIEANQLQGQQQDLLGQQDAGRMAYLQALLRQGRQGAAEFGAGAQPGIMGGMGMDSPALGAGGALGGGAPGAVAAPPVGLEAFQAAQAADPNSVVREGEFQGGQVAPRVPMGGATAAPGGMDPAMVAELLRRLKARDPNSTVREGELPGGY